MLKWVIVFLCILFFGCWSIGGVVNNVVGVEVVDLGDLGDFWEEGELGELGNMGVEVDLSGIGFLMVGRDKSEICCCVWLRSFF